jgi:triphosphatase
MQSGNTAATSAADRPAGELAIEHLSRLFSEFLGHEPAVREGNDPEAVHDMRVAGRRMRAAMGFFEETLTPELMRLREELGWTGDALGAVRDLDIQIEWLRGLMNDASMDEQTALGEVLRVVRGQREAAEQLLREAFASPRYEALVRDMASALYRGAADVDASRAPLRELAWRLRRRYRQFRKQASKLRADSAVTDFHAVRRRAKKLRYEVEFLAPLYGRAAKRFLAAMTEVQDLLGEHQDHVVANEHLRSLAVEHGSELAPATLLLMGRLAERNEREAKKLRRRWGGVYEGLRDAWRGLGKKVTSNK